MGKQAAPRCERDGCTSLSGDYYQGNSRRRKAKKTKITPRTFCVESLTPLYIAKSETDPPKMGWQRTAHTRTYLYKLLPETQAVSIKRWRKSHPIFPQAEELLSHNGSENFFLGVLLVPLLRIASNGGTGALRHTQGREAKLTINHKQYYSALLRDFDISPWQRPQAHMQCSIGIFFYGAEINNLRPVVMG